MGNSTSYWRPGIGLEDIFMKTVLGELHILYASGDSSSFREKLSIIMLPEVTSWSEIRSSLSPGMTQGREARERSSGSNRSLCPVLADFCLLPVCSSAFASFLVETRCIIDGWLIGNSITQRLLGWQTVGHRYPVRTIELECRRGGKVSFRDASPRSADLLGMPNGHCLVQLLTDDLPHNCSRSGDDRPLFLFVQFINTWKI